MLQQFLGNCCHAKLRTYPRHRDGLAPCCLYRERVHWQATNAQGPGAFSAPVEFATESAPPDAPAAPAAARELAEGCA
jgi:hypothetical protein